MFNRLSVGNKLNTLLLAALAGVLLISALALYSKYQRMLDDRRTSLQNMVQVAVGVLEFYERQVKAGSLPLASAQEQAKHAVGNLRYANKEYYYLFDMHPRMLWHPIKPELNGQDLTRSLDPDGKPLFVAMRDVVASQGGGFVEYLWPQPGKTEPVAKLAYVQGFAPWGWMVGTGLYLDDLNAQFERDALWFFGQIVLLSAVLGGLVLLIKRALTRPVHALVKTMRQVDEQRDLTCRTELGAEDELGTVGRAFNHLLGSIQHTFSEVWGGSERLASRASSLSGHARQLAGVSAQQNQAVASSAAALEEISASIEEVSGMAERLGHQAEQTHAQTGHGEAAVAVLTTTLHQAEHSLRDDVGGSARQMADSMDDITRMTCQVRDIAEQTNLLALNAAIEAARAGQAGRGFAVVADEVRKLAEKSAASAGQIDQLTERLQHSSAAMHQAIQRNEQVMETGVRQAAQVSQVLVSASQAAQETRQRIGDINAALVAQNHAVQQIASDMQHIAGQSDTQHAVVHDSAGAAHELEALAVELRGAVARFKTQ
ncbi:MAG: hypothetical protein RI925_1726 [Pseudomonadota bacterium]|jgi:methyl-accepting chemotaxis protein